ncbi:MAG: NAD(P)-binding domain-containing protein [Lachnospiraceae bacterium]|nr:NAD(P)-binding domain-containing protein [Lachnospiraceae bacterium]
MKKLLITGWIPENILECYQDRFEIVMPDHEKTNFTGEEVAAMIGDFDALFTISAFPFRKDLIDKAVKLKAVANFGVGYDNIDWKYCTEKKIFVVNTMTTVTEPTAELAFSIMLAITKGVVMYDRELRKTRKCDPEMFFDRDILLYGKTIGIIGYGRIGQAIGRRAQGIGMKVMYYDPFRKSPEEEAKLGATYGSFDEVLANADVISCHMPYTKENHHIFNLETFRKMKPGAYFVNAARGPVMCEADLVTALKEKIIRGAATDVFEFEPKVSEDLAAIDNVVITPHIGSNVLEARTNMVHEALDGVYAIFEGKQPINVVNRELF